jgi:hypothetical protein
MSIFFQFAPKIGEMIKLALDHYAVLRASGGEVTPDLIAEFLTTKMTDWNPQIGGVEILDQDTKRAGARFIAGIAFNVAGGGGVKEKHV